VSFEDIGPFSRDGAKDYLQLLGGGLALSFPEARPPIRRGRMDSNYQRKGIRGEKKRVNQKGKGSQNRKKLNFILLFLWPFFSFDFLGLLWNGICGLWRSDALPSPCLTLFGSETSPSRGKQR
jgi:hypothetical protein